MSGIDRDPWLELAARTPARIALGRTGASLPTREVLSFALAHAQARDAVHARLDRDAIAVRLAELGLSSVTIESDAQDRATYLRRPDFGRRLSAASFARLLAAGKPACDIALMIADGLSATAVEHHAVPVVAALLTHFDRLRVSLGPVAIAEGARVALGDEVGALLGARLVAVLIGERPGLTAPDSLGIYVTYAPRPGRTDAERNCISNVRPQGLAPELAAARLAWLIDAALRRGLTGVDLKDESDSESALAEARTPGLYPTT